jgi:hypothetical protein
MRKISASILIALSILSGLGGVVDKTEGTLGIGKPKTEQFDSRNDAGSRSPLVEFVLSGAFAAAAGLVGGRSGGDKDARFDVERIVRRGEQGNFSEAEIANAFNKSEAGIRQLILYLCEDLGLGKTNVERVSFVYDASELIVSVRGFVQADNTEKLDKLNDLIMKLLSEKLHRAAQINTASVGGFDEAIRRAVDEQVAEGREKLMQTIRLFSH